MNRITGGRLWDTTNRKEKVTACALLDGWWNRTRKRMLVSGCGVPSGFSWNRTYNLGIEVRDTLAVFWKWEMNGGSIMPAKEILDWLRLEDIECSALNCKRALKQVK